jgi:hypothetical protein
MTARFLARYETLADPCQRAWTLGWSRQAGMVAM